MGLAKICRKHNIPLPERGHWRKVETGKRTTQKPLPKSKNVNIKIVITSREKKKEIEITYSDTFKEIKKKELDPINKITVTDTLKHKYTIRAEKILSNSRNEDNGIIISRTKNPPPIFVSKNTLTRALQIVDTVLLELEMRKFRIKWPKDHKRYFSTNIENIEIGFSITEKMDRKDHVPTREEKAEQKKLGWRTWPKWNYVPSGKLSLNLLIPKNLWNIKLNWHEGKIKRIENQLNNFIVEVYKVAEEHKQSEERKKQREIEDAERRREFLEQENQRIEFKRKMDFIFSSIEQWKESKSLTEYCVLFKESCSQKILTSEQKNLADEIIRLLTNRINQINPLINISNFLDEFSSKYSWHK